MTPRYRIKLFWSHEDRAWLAGLPDLPFTTADGETPEAALQGLGDVLDLVIESRTARGAALPPVVGAAGSEPPIWREFRQYLTVDCEIDIAWSDDDAVWIARVPEMPRIAAHGDTPEQAVREVVIALDAAIAAMQEAGIAIPVPGAAAHAA